MTTMFSCASCGIGACDKLGKALPPNCTTKQISQELLSDVMEEYSSEENYKIMEAAANVEYEGYGVLTRVQEIVAFAQQMGYQKIGIATCVGLLREAKALGKILQFHGFEIFGIACKAGTVTKVSIGLPENCAKIGVNMCNPILQAKKLNEKQTDMNIVVGLCVGHDSLFYKYSDAIVTTAVVKDRVTGHNPAVVLYQLDSYYKKILTPK